ncbi:MAG: Major Facilitator Superfamily protein [bacterium ADurb.Bin429]|nr:MAG: Major Facilitator Superfamily protein [bacterium ADurb.Bin429]
MHGMIALFANRQLRRMIIPLLLTELLWGMGTFFTLPATTMAAYLQALQASPVIIGLIVTVMGSLVVLPQFFSRSVVERFRHRKRGIILLHICVLTPYFLIPLCDRLLRESSPGLLIGLILLLLGISQVLIGFIVPAWLDMVGRLIPMSVRGSYFGIASSAFSLGGILAGQALIWMARGLGEKVFPVAFLASGVCFVCSMVAFACAPVPESAFQHAPEPSMLTRLRTALAACHPRGDLGRFLLSNVLFTLALGITAFVTVFAGDPNGLGMPPTVFSYLTQMQAVGGAAAALILGWAVDRHSPRRPWAVVILLLPAALLLLPHGASLPMLTVCALLLGTFITLWAITGPAVLELSPDGDKSGFVAIVNVAAFPANAFGPLLMGAVINLAGYRPAFLLAIGIAAFALIPALLLRRRTAPDPAPHQMTHH